MFFIAELKMPASALYKLFTSKVVEWGSGEWWRRRRQSWLVAVLGELHKDEGEEGDDDTAESGGTNGVETGVLGSSASG